MREFEKVLLWRITMRQDGRVDEVVYIANNGVLSAIEVVSERFASYDVHDVVNIGEVLVEVQ